MYALINKQKMELVCRFPDLDARSADHRNPPFVTINLEDERSLSAEFTLLELQILYRNLGSVLGTVWSEKASVRLSVFRLIQARPVVSPKQIGLLEAYEPSNQETANAQGGTGRVSTGAAATALTVNGAALRGNKAVIWAVADAMWEAYGKPMNVERILPLRREMMTELETKHGIKRTSSSTALGEWQKVRLAQ